MSLKQCPACSGQVSSSANICPHCGHRLRMSGIAFAIVTLVSVFIGMAFLGMLMRA